MLGDRVDQWGLREYLVRHGTARLADDGPAELVQRLADTYLGPDVVFPGMPVPYSFIMRVGVEHISGVASMAPPMADSGRRPELEDINVR